MRGFETGERVIVSEGEIGTLYKGTQSDKNMIKMGTKCCDEGEVGVIMDSDWITRGGGLYRYKKYQIDLGNEYGHLWFSPSQMKRI